jgi:hypothetical protein
MSSTLFLIIINDLEERTQRWPRARRGRGSGGSRQTAQTADGGSSVGSGRSARTTHGGVEGCPYSLAAPDSPSPSSDLSGPLPGWDEIEVQVSKVSFAEKCSVRSSASKCSYSKPLLQASFYRFVPASESPVTLSHCALGIALVPQAQAPWSEAKGQFLFRWLKLRSTTAVPWLWWLLKSRALAGVNPL